MTYEVAPLRWFFPPQPAKTASRRIARDAIGVFNVVCHYLMRLLPTDLVSLMTQEIWSRVGPHRYPDIDARVAETWKRLRPAEASTRQIEEAKLTRWRNLGRVIGEYSVLDRLWPAGRIELEGERHLANAKASDRPVIVMGLHLGNWEALAPAIAGLGHRVVSFYQRPADRIDHWLVIKARRRYGVTLLEPDPKSARAALRILQERSGVLLIYADEWIDGRINAPAFGRERRLEGNIANIVRLAAMTDAIVIPAFAVRTGGSRFRLRFLPPADLVAETHDNALAENIRRLDALLEPVVRTNLDQWLMLFEFRFDR